MRLDRKRENCLVEEILIQLGVLEWNYNSEIKSNLISSVKQSITNPHGTLVLWVEDAELMFPKRITWSWYNTFRLRRAIRKQVKRIERCIQEEEAAKVSQSLLKIGININCQ